jgi:predicted phage terminase large subunit-like protein
MAVNDLYFFAKYILDFWWLCWEPHKPFADDIQSDKNLTLFLLPRGHCKSLLFTDAHSIQCYLKQPDEPIFILSYSVAQATKKLLVIKNIFESNNLFRSLFPEFTYQNPKKQSKKWTEEEIVLPGHTGRQESSISAWSILSMPTGMHARRIKCDDLITPENSTSREQMDKISSAYGMVRSSILQPDGNIQICGTIYDDGDLHRDMERSNAYRVYKRSSSYEIRDKMEIPCPPDSPRAQALWPVQYPLSVQIEIKNDPTVGNYIFSCLSGKMRIFMADWSLRPIKDVRVGEEVLGFKTIKGSKTRIIKTKVLAFNKSKNTLIRSVMGDGSVVEHTKNHNWWTGRRGIEKKRERREYSPLGFKKNHDQQSLCQLMNLNWTTKKYSEQEHKDLAWLSGFFDGEGSVSAGTINFTQSTVKHPQVWERLCETLDRSGFDYGVYDDFKRKQSAVAYIRGGREEKVRFLNLCNPAKKEQIITGLMNHSSRDFGVRSRVELEKQEEIGICDVYNIQTETGNYFAEGFASKNCQYLLDPSPQDDNAFFKLEWFGRYKEPPKTLTIYAAGDLAISKRDGAAYTAIPIIGLDPDHRIYVLHVNREHWDSMQIVDNLISTQKNHHPVLFGLEVENIERTIGPFLKTRMLEEKVFLNIVEIKPTEDKIARARSIQGRAQQGFVMLPENGPNQPAWLADFEYELTHFPRAKTKDQVDSLSIIGIMIDQYVSLYQPPKKKKLLADAHIDAMERPNRNTYQEAALRNQRLTMKHIEHHQKKERDGLYHDLD